jgi:hypothetical protein
MTKKAAKVTLVSAKQVAVNERFWLLFDTALDTAGAETKVRKEH